MAKLNDIFENAIDHTKRKVREDIAYYFNQKEKLPPFPSYLADRSHYIDQIWINIWLNKVTNNVSKTEKKAILQEHGYDVDGVAWKVINDVFRNEMRQSEYFDVRAWLEKQFRDNPDEWETFFEKAKADFKVAKENKIIQDQKKSEKKALQDFSKRFIEKNSILLYLYARKFIANKLAEDFLENKEYQFTESKQKVIDQGSHEGFNYVTLRDFLTEWTGHVHNPLNWHPKHYEYEAYYYEYEQALSAYCSELIPTLILKAIPSKDLSKYEKTLDTNIFENEILEVTSESIFSYINKIVEKMEEEYVEDLLNLSKVEFNASLHKEIYLDDMAAKEIRKREEAAEEERQREQETRILDDLFGREFSSHTRGNIKYVLHIGETNTGKTYQALKRMKEAKTGLYLAPLRLLALEVFDTLNNSGIPCSLKTGEEEKTVENATHLSSTVEMFHEKDYYEVIVIDEAQMLADKDRGYSWFKAITKANADEVHVIGSRNIKSMIMDMLGDASVELHEYRRDIPLEVEKKEYRINQAKKGDALVCFSRKRVLETASKLQHDGHSVSMIYGSMPPETRKKQMQLFLNGETEVIVATDAIGMGLNLPIRRIVFMESEKFDGTRRRRLTSQEVKQIAGRAGRKGIYNTGKVSFQQDPKAMSRLLHQDDHPISVFTVAPSHTVLERFQKYNLKLEVFFDLWEKFEGPKGTKKATLSEEKELYELIRDTEIEGRLSVIDLYSFLHLPFSTKEQQLKEQWKNTMYAIVRREELPEPIIKKDSLEAVELSYKAVGLHLLFLYRLERHTEAHYWELIRHELSDNVHELLKDNVSIEKVCRKCGKKLPRLFTFNVCDKCYGRRYDEKHKSVHRRLKFRR